MDEMTGCAIAGIGKWSGTALPPYRLAISGGGWARPRRCARPHGRPQRRLSAGVLLPTELM